MLRHQQNELASEIAYGLGEFEYESEAEAEFEQLLRRLDEALYESHTPRPTTPARRPVTSRRTGEGKVGPLSISALNCETGHLLHNFDINGATLKPAHQRFLRERIVEVLRNVSNRVELIGRASRSGSPALNLRLSEKRAKAVADFLRREGVQNQQIGIQAIGNRSPFSMSREAEEDRSVEVRPRITPVFTLALVDVGLIPRSNVVIDTIKQAIEPLVRRAGRELKIVRSVGPSSGDVTITFDRGGRERQPCGRLTLGVEGGGDIFVGAHQDLRVCSGMVLDAQGRPDHQSQLERVFEPNEPEFAQAIANTAVHELGHMMAQLPHVNNTDNFMHEANAALGANLPRDLRTLERMRRHFAGRKSFSPEQARHLVCAIQTNFFPGGMRSRRTRGPVTPPISPKTPRTTRTPRRP